MNRDLQGHISDDKWNLWLAAEPEQESDAAAIDSHLAACGECRAEAERLKAMVTGFCEVVRKETMLDDAFWACQRAEILQCVRAPKSSRSMRWLLPVPVAALALVIAGVLMKPADPKPVPMTPSDARDEALLLQVQNDAYRQVPSALAPAGLLVEERNRVLSSKKSQNK